MSHILAYTSPGRGHLFPATSILLELFRRGHEISVRTLASDVPLMRSLGFDGSPVNPEIEAIGHDDWLGRNPMQAFARAVRVLAARAEHDAPDLQGALDQLKPDALLVDVNTWGALSAAEAWGGPWATFCPYPLPVSSPDVPPFGPGLAPARGPLGRLRDGLLGPLFVGAAERTLVPAVNRVRSRYDLAPLGNGDEMFGRPPLLIYMTAEPFEYPRRDWPANVVMVGPCEWDPPAEPPEWITELPHPIVLVTTSSEFQNDDRLIRVALEALAGEPLSVVATIPSGDPGTFKLPSNARVERFVPHGPVLDRAVCAVTHGGMGATQKALARGVPVCVVPFGRDQLEVARRAELARAGTRLPSSRLRPDRLRRKVFEARAQAEGAKRLAQAFEAAGGPQAAADAIEARLLAGRRGEGSVAGAR